MSIRHYAAVGALAATVSLAIPAPTAPSTVSAPTVRTTGSTYAIPGAPLLMGCHAGSGHGPYAVWQADGNAADRWADDAIDPVSDTSSAHVIATCTQITD